MRPASQTSFDRTQTKKQVLAIAFLVCVIVVSLLSEAFILIHANHAHDHNDAHGTCAACTHIQNAENILRQLGTAVSGVSFSLVGLFAASAIPKAISTNAAIFTPVMQKIRMNN